VINTELILCRTIGCTGPFSRWFMWPHRHVCTRYSNWRYPPPSRTVPVNRSLEAELKAEALFEAADLIAAKPGAFSDDSHMVTYVQDAEIARWLRRRARHLLEEASCRHEEDA
jgi:hypothetical protein